MPMVELHLARRSADREPCLRSAQGTDSHSDATESCRAGSERNSQTSESVGLGAEVGGGIIGLWGGCEQDLADCRRPCGYAVSHPRQEVGGRLAADLLEIDHVGAVEDTEMNDVTGNKMQLA